MPTMRSAEPAPCVSVVVPTFNRGHLLARTIPPFAQPEVIEIILVDDGSTDDTPEVAERLSTVLPVLRYHRLAHNSGQAAAKNAGISLCQAPFVYFGDDDHLLLEGSIAALLNCMREEQADIAGSRAVSMLPGETIEETLIRTGRGRAPVVNMRRLITHFSNDPGAVLRVPYTAACCLMPAELARTVKFDETLLGSGYREETDFLLRCAETGARIVFCPQAITVNVPRAEATGGAWSHGLWAYESSALRNNWVFLKRHHEFLAEEWGLRTPKWLLQVSFIGERLSFRTRSLLKNMLPAKYVAAVRKMRSALRQALGTRRR